MDLLKEAVDTSFFTDSMFKNLGSVKKEKQPRKSQRFLPEPEEVDRELPVTDSMKKFMSKKLSDLVAEKICFTEESTTDKKSPKEDAEGGGIKLLRGFSEYVAEEDVPEVKVERPKPPKRRKNQKNSEEISEEEKIQQSCISPDQILNQDATKGWSTKTKRLPYQYRKKNNKLHLEEPQNDFTELRRKNNWDESKIAKYKRSR
ncbi:uncharacterized protein LOC129793911 isoform X2 [Lutzomyia longipalpis]|uniref:uncharacterized protein LOC129793911 isoform X2 n=1 Tax=Lutzomyia longipalpis TaxID=7200 RepID=UPI00248343C6|nr:uncharacterized protein LOC129793911 isoform X2 [Lutzomyia longipalpis]